MISINGADKEKRRKYVGGEQMSEHENERKREKGKWDCMCANENERERYLS